MNAVQKGIVTLLKSAITGLKLELPDNFSLESEEAKKVVKRHHLTTLIYIGALNCGISTDTPVMKSLVAGYYKHLLRSEKQMKLVREVFDAFDANGIDYLPTKGCNMKSLYPQPELRIMGDADVFIREEKCPQIAEIMTSLGFVLSHDTKNDFSWDKDVLHLELHKKMLSFYNKDYYRNVWSRVVLLHGNCYGFTKEDAFIHIFNHFARHYRGSGIGLRHVMDLYVYRRTYPDMNEEYICQELNTLRLQKFYENVLRLIDYWFEDGKTDDVTEHLTNYIFNSGSWGSVTSHVLSKEATRANNEGEVSNTKRKVILKYTFPTKSYMKILYPWVDKYPALLPVTWVLRGIDILRFRRKNVKLITQAWKSVNDKNVSEYQKQFKLVGLDLFDEEGVEEDNTM